MSGLYDLFLHRTFSGTLSSRAFRAGLTARSVFFFLRNTIGRLTCRVPNRCATINPDSVKKILLIRTDRIGDIVLSTPCIHAIKSRYPDAQVDYLVLRKYEPLLHCYPGWNDIITIKNLNDSRERRNAGEKIAAKRYDVCIVQHPSAGAYVLARRAHAAFTIGWDAKGYGYSLSHPLLDRRAQWASHQVENNLKLLTPLGICEKSPRFVVTETESGMRQVHSFFSAAGISNNEKIVCIHPSSFSPRVQWPVGRFRSVSEALAEDGYRIIVLGSGSDRQAVNAVVSQDPPSSRVVAACDVFDLQGVVSLMHRARLFIGNSTGPMHIAASVGIWTIAIFGIRYGMDREELWRPWGPRGIPLSTPLHLKRCARCIPWTCQERPCLRSVSVDMVLEKAREALQKAETCTTTL